MKCVISVAHSSGTKSRFRDHPSRSLAASSGPHTRKNQYPTPSVACSVIPGTNSWTVGVQFKAVRGYLPRVLR